MLATQCSLPRTVFQQSLARSVDVAASLLPFPKSPRVFRDRVTSVRILPFFSSSQMAGGGPTSQGSKYTHNDAAFVEYNTRLQSGNLPTFTTAASKLTEWLGSDKAYYPNARVPVRLRSWPLL